MKEKSRDLCFLLCRDTDDNPIRKLVALGSLVWHGLFDRGRSNPVLRGLRQFGKLTHLPSRLDQRIECVQLEGQLADADVIVVEPGVLHQMLVILLRGSKIDRPVWELVHGVMRG